MNVVIENSGLKGWKYTEEDLNAKFQELGGEVPTTQLINGLQIKFEYCFKI